MDFIVHTGADPTGMGGSCATFSWPPKKNMEPKAPKIIEPNPLAELPELVEGMCNRLRALRRERPQEFFYSPEETLYRSLEAALENFYRYKARPQEFGEQAQ